MKDTLASRWSVVLGLALLATMSLGGGSAPGNAVEARSPAGTINGFVTFVGQVPRPERLLVHRDSTVCGETMPDEALQVDPETSGIASAVISLQGGESLGQVAAAEPLVIENANCRFRPRAIAGQVGEIEIRNSDPIMHNTHIKQGSKYGANVINVIQPVGAKPIVKRIDAPAVLDVRCDAHPFMQASVHLFSHRYFAVTDAQGRFQLPPVPPGTYTLRLWHETLGTRERTVTVTSTQPVPLTWRVGPQI